MNLEDVEEIHMRNPQKLSVNEKVLNKLIH